MIIEETTAKVEKLASTAYMMPTDLSLKTSFAFAMILGKGIPSRKNTGNRKIPDRSSLRTSGRLSKL